MTEINAPVDVERTQLLQLAVRREWTTLKQILNTLEKGDPEISQVDETSGLSLLMIAVQENQLHVVERLLELEVNPGEKTKDGQTALHIAAFCSKDDIVKLLASKTDPNTPGGPKAQLPLHYAASRPDDFFNVVHSLLKFSNTDARDTQDEDGYIPLLLAVKAGNVGIVKELLSDRSESQLMAKTKENGDTALHICCRRRHADMARVLMEFNVNLNCQNDEGQTPLHIAAWEDDQAMLKLFYHRTANPNIADKLGRCPLHIAAERGHTTAVEVLTELLNSNVLERTKDGSTLLHIASQCGNLEMLQSLLKKGVPLHMADKSGAVCLHVAAKFGHKTVVQVLLQRGLHVDATNKDGLTALHVAVENCKPKVVQILLGSGAQVQLRGGKALEMPLHIAARVKDGEKVAEMLLKSGAEVNTEQDNGETAMHIAACHGNLQTMGTLLEEGADLTWRSKAEETPLHVAVRHCHAHIVVWILEYLTRERHRKGTELCVRQANQKGETTLHLAAEIQKNIVHRDDEDVQIIRTLMEYNADITAATREKGETPIHYCARIGNVAVLQEMLNNVPSNCLQTAINKQDKTGRSPLLLAAELGHMEVVRLLLERNARVDVFDEEGKSALHLAAQQGHEDIADILLSYKAFVNAKTKLGLTPLHLSAQTGSSHLVQLLIKAHKAPIDALTLSKQTPLHLAAISGNLDICENLFSIDTITAKDIHGQTPLHLAAENDHSDIVKLFLQKMPDLATLPNMEGATCINIAAAKGSLTVIRELLKLSQEDPTTLNNKANGSCPLHLAAAGGHTEVVKALLEAGASAEEEDLEGMTAVHLAARHGHIDILEILKTKVSLKITSFKTGLTALHVAAYFGQVEVVREILTDVPATICSEPPGRDARRKEQPPEESEYTPLHIAAQSGHEDVVRLLLNSPGVLPDAKTKPECFTPLHLAAQNGHTAVVGLLLSKSSALLPLRDRRGRTCLHLACASGHVATARDLLCHGAVINDTDKEGWTALHFAAKSGWLELVQFLVESGASVQAECFIRRTPLQYAAEGNHLTTLSFLLQQPNNNILKLLKSRKFVFDLMVCGKQNDNIALEEVVLFSASPLDTAVHLSRALSLVSLKEKVRFADLQAAARHCETMASDLLITASTAEGLNAGKVLRAVEYNGKSMLDCLIQRRQKNVMSIPAVQEYLTEVWYGNLQWASWKILLLLFGLLFCPPLWLALSLPLKHRFRFIPVVKMMSHLVSHIFLLALFILTIVYPPMSPPSACRLNPGWCEWFLLFWVCGMLLSEFTQTAKRMDLAWIRVLLLVFSGLALLCHLLAVILYLAEELPVHVSNCLFARNILLAIAMTLGFIQLLEFLMFHHLFGPWVIIIKNLIKDLCRFGIVLLFFLIAFSLSFTAICQPVYTLNQGDITVTPCNKSISEPLGANATPKMTPLNGAVLLFFALFGLTDQNQVICSDETAGFIKLVFGIYLVLTVIVLLNLLIAMMSNTYQCIQEQSDTEWKFGRAIHIRDMSCKPDAPSPFNLLTSLFFCVRSLCKNRGKLCSLKRQALIREEEEADILPETQSLNTVDHTCIRWFKENQTTQFLPQGSLIVMPQQEEQVHIENVTEWRKVVQRFLILRGQKDRASPENDHPPSSEINHPYSMLS
ncbi:serine/threonine-protein phosphatase 6 regulatory ankyrin repeat subunit A-like isoform X1 [Clarias gariepinus]|uniref:serine/threonine-protein phosphatase 6 regulatory ankyrin repeat subunit A-like isoform X1 n=1 Tax=Clarias gariepinus TaxID=13013 RepID=UPI00234CB923|nr:serine/threonine-protein phosphatase 6 regulatory ankyrin repeat subunit A-like isoform X1 [Clarias gariepinus]